MAVRSDLAADSGVLRPAAAAAAASAAMVREIGSSPFKESHTIGTQATETVSSSWAWQPNQARAAIRENTSFVARALRSFCAEFVFCGVIVI